MLMQAYSTRKVIRNFIKRVADTVLRMNDNVCSNNGLIINCSLDKKKGKQNMHILSVFQI